MSDPLLDLVRALRAELAEALAVSRREGSSVPVAKIAQRSLKAIAGASPAAPSWACARGCSFCCHNAVSVSAPEAFRLAQALRAASGAEGQALRERLTARAAEVRGLSLAEQAARRTPCALLASDGACSVHAARPLPCIGMVSMDRSACQAVFEDPATRTRIPVDRVYFSVAGAHNLALRLAARDAGLSHLRYELHDALAVALSEPDAERRWLAGEDPFAGCRPDPTSVGEAAEAELERFAALTAGR